MRDTYTDIKNKTIEWCKKLLDEGIYDQKQYDDCVNDFVDISQGDGLMPRDTPITSNKHSYGLHRENSTINLEKMLNKSSSQSNETNKFRLGVVGSSGLYLATNDNGDLKLSTGRDISKPEEIEWNIDVNSGDTYVISSSLTGKYIAVDRGDLVSARRKGIDPSTIWRIRESESGTTFESVLHKGKKMTLTNPISITSGISEAHNINITNSGVENEQSINYYDPSELHLQKKMIVGKLNKLLREKYIKLIEIRFLFSLAAKLEDMYCVAMKKIIKNVDKENLLFKSEMNRMIPTLEYNDPNLLNGTKDDFIGFNFSSITNSINKLKETTTKNLEEQKKLEAERIKLLDAKQKADLLRKYNDTLKARIPSIKDFIEEYNVVGTIFNEIDNPETLKTLKEYSIFRKDNNLIRDDFPVKTVTRTCEDIRGNTFPVLEELIKHKRKHALDLLKMIDEALNKFNDLNYKIKTEERNLNKFISDLKEKTNDNERLIKINQKTISSLSSQINELDDEINSSLEHKKNIKTQDILSDINFEKLKHDTNSSKKELYLIVSICTLALIMCVFSLMKFSNQINK